MTAPSISFDAASRLVARNLGIASSVLQDGFRLATAADLPRILELRRRGLDGGITWNDDRYLRWRYDLGTERSGFGDLHVADYGGSILGMIGMERVFLTRGKESVPAVSLMDILVDPAVADCALGAWMNMALFAAYERVIEIGANPNSLPLISRLYQLLPNRVAYFHGIRTERYFRKRLPLRSAATLLGACVDLSTRLLRVALLSTIPPGHELRDIEQFDDAVDELWRERYLTSEFAVERSSRWLNWRLRENTRTRYQIVGLYAGSILSGYMAFRQRQGPERQIVTEVADWLVRRTHSTRLFKCLLGETLRRAERAGSESLIVTALHASTGRQLAALGFLARQNRHFTVGVHCRAADEQTRLTSQAQWFVTAANTDDDL